LTKYEGTFGEIERKMPKNQGNQGGNGELPNPFMA
jgi:hypothetical protein